MKNNKIFLSENDVIRFISKYYNNSINKSIINEDKDIKDMTDDELINYIDTLKSKYNKNNNKDSKEEEIDKIKKFSLPDNLKFYDDYNNNNENDLDVDFNDIDDIPDNGKIPYGTIENNPYSKTYSDFIKKNNSKNIDFNNNFKNIKGKNLNKILNTPKNKSEVKKEGWYIVYDKDRENKGEPYLNIYYYGSKSTDADLDYKFGINKNNNSYKKQYKDIQEKKLLSPGQWFDEILDKNFHCGYIPVRIGSNYLYIDTLGKFFRDEKGNIMNFDMAHPFNDSTCFAECTYNGIEGYIFNNTPRMVNGIRILKNGSDNPVEIKEKVPSFNNYGMNGRVFINKFEYDNEILPRIKEKEIYKDPRNDQGQRSEEFKKANKNRNSNK